MEAMTRWLLALSLSAAVSLSRVPSAEIRRSHGKKQFVDISSRTRKQKVGYATFSTAVIFVDALFTDRVSGA